MDYKKKYLKYKDKYLEHKLLGGSVMTNVLQDIDAYDSYQLSRINDKNTLNKYISGLDYIKSKVYEYLVELNSEGVVVEYEIHKNMTQNIRNVFDECKTNFWLNFVRQAAFVEYTFYGSNLRDKFYIYPATNDDFRTIFSIENFLPNHDDSNLPVVMYDFRNRFIALQFTDLMMLDFDWKDFDENDDPIIAEKYIVEKLIKLKSLFTFLLFRTDRGLHVFIINKSYPHTDLESIDIMLSFCADPFYTAFSYKYGYCIRANPKEKNLDDRVVFPGFLDKVGDDIDIPLIFSEDNSHLIGNELYYSNGNYKNETYVSQLPSFEFESSFLGYTISLHYFKLDDIDENNRLANTKKLVLIGRKDKIISDLFKKSLLQYVLIQFLRHIKSNPGKIDDYLIKFEKGISDLIFYDRDTLNELPNTNSIKELRSDIENIIHKFNELFM